MNVPLLARDPADLLQNTDFLWLTGALVATLLVGAFVLSRVERWRKRQLSDSPASDVETFSSYRAMYENGELSKEEYDRIKAKEARRLRDKVLPRSSPLPPAQKELPANPSTPPQEPPSAGE